jgi:hypothetical protein
LFQSWREEELAPLVAEQELERQKAAVRKTEILRAQIASALRRRVASEALPTSSEAVSQSRTADTALQTTAGQITAFERRLDERTLTLTRRGPDVLRRAAELIDAKHDSSEALTQAFREVTGEVAGDIARELEDLSITLRHARQRVADSVQWTGADADEASDADTVFRGVPVPALPPELSVPTEGAERLLGHGLARSIVTKRLEQSVGRDVNTTLDSYAAVLRRWALDHLDVIRVEWTATTDALRADIDRRLGHAQTVPGDPADVEQDLQRLLTLAQP